MLCEQNWYKGILVGKSMNRSSSLNSINRKKPKASRTQSSAASVPMFFDQIFIYKPLLFAFNAMWTQKMLVDLKENI
ncbi:hypothetical protein D2V08_03330 [Flagellimonas lutimaris]|uniref:Uncharacterized protein n=1 Tax=Flagellimonas lutimaris TaxID=475082 RepID=A0A3A1NCH6_9FLAO|nr:hypothetical protein D2V08_03330 [Allomuricauda lutimaris]